MSCSLFITKCELAKRKQRVKYTNRAKKSTCFNFQPPVSYIVNLQQTSHTSTAITAVVAAAAAADFISAKTNLTSVRQSVLRPVCMPTYQHFSVGDLRADRQTVHNSVGSANFLQASPFSQL
jgi:hypothetical protein